MLPCNGTRSSQQTRVYYLSVTSGRTYGRFKPPRCLLFQVPYFPAYKTHRPIRRTMIFSLDILEKNGDESILILVIYWKKTGLLHILL
jgi:hypothetical protein